MTRILTNLSPRISFLPREPSAGYKQRGIRCIRQCGTASVDTDRDTADQIARAHRESSPEKRVSGVVAAAREDVILGDKVEFRREDDRNDDTVDRNDFAEDDGDQVLGPDSGCFHSAANDR